MENLEEVVHVEDGWTTLRTGEDTANRTDPPGTRPTDVEETNPYSGWLQRVISPMDIMNHE